MIFSRPLLLVFATCTLVSQNAAAVEILSAPHRLSGFYDPETMPFAYRVKIKNHNNQLTDAELVYRYSTDSAKYADLASPKRSACANSALPDGTTNHDFADIPARAALLKYGGSERFVVFAGHLKHYRMIGTSINALARNCSIVNQAEKSNNFFQYKSREWLSSFYSKDGQNVVAFIQNDWIASGSLAASERPAACVQGNDCQWMSLTSEVSSNGGTNFSLVDTNNSGTIFNTDYLIARANVAALGDLSTQAERNNLHSDGFVGFYHTTNILRPVKRADGSVDPYLYMVMRYRPEKGGSARFCLMRSSTSAETNDPASWQGYTGTNPSTGAHTWTRASLLNDANCVAPFGNSFLQIRHLSYNLHYNAYIAFGLKVIGGVPQLAFMKSNGNNLMDWGTEDAVPIVAQWDMNTTNELRQYDYFNLIDHEYQYVASGAISPTENGKTSLVQQAVDMGLINQSELSERRTFDLTGRDPWIYATLRRCPRVSGQSDEAQKTACAVKTDWLDLVRFPIRLE